MADQATTAGLISTLAGRQRVLSLGGYAVISHGHSRPTYDADVWLDPMLAVENWCAALGDLGALASLRFVEIGTWREIEPGELAAEGDPFAGDLPPED